MPSRILRFFLLISFIGWGCGDNAPGASQSQTSNKLMRYKNTDVTIQSKIVPDQINIVGNHTHTVDDPPKNVESHKTTTESPIPINTSDWDVSSLCQKYKNVPYPESDKPTPAQAKKLKAKGCNSNRLYYGIGGRARPSKARLCAFIELDAGDNLIFGGSNMLMMIYANGKGAEQNIDLALSIACAMGENAAPAEMDGRVKHLLRLANQTNPSESTKPFDLCDDITSGFMSGHCEQNQNEARRAWREHKLKKMITQWDQNQQQAFQKMHKKATLFFKARCRNEIDASGTMRGAYYEQEQNRLEIMFLKSLLNFQKGKFPTYSQAQYKQADKELNKVYQKIMQLPKDPVYVTGMVTQENIRKTERIWLAYRDEWMRFATVKYPDVSDQSWLTWLTIERTKQLRRLVDYF